MTVYFFPGCKYRAHDPEKTEKLSEYLSKKHGVVTTGCCSIDHVLPGSEDTVLYQCPTCGLILAESSKHAKLMSVYEFLLEDEDYVWPDLSGKQMTIQDCWRTRNDRSYCEAVRKAAEKMNINAKEIENHFEKTDFCGATLYRVPSPRYETLAPESLVKNGNFHPCSEEEQKEKMIEHGKQYETDEVICYCTGCMEGVQMGGHEPVHLLDLILSSL